MSALVPVASLKWFEFNQNNSGGRWHKSFGKRVFIQALDAKHANGIAEDIGIYFNGVEEYHDCSCCGDRWSTTYDSRPNWTDFYVDYNPENGFRKWVGNNKYAAMTEDEIIEIKAAMVEFDDISLIVPFQEKAFCHVPPKGSRWGFEEKDLESKLEEINRRWN